MSYVLLITDRPEKVFAANTFSPDVSPHQSHQGGEQATAVGRGSRAGHAWGWWLGFQPRQRWGL